MTNEQINEAIAEACGWRKEDGVYVWTAHGIDCTYFELWDWANDLNAMHLAEKVLTIQQEKDYFANLRGVVGDLIWYRTVGKTYRATARQRAEAFLRTLGKWQEATDKDSLTVGGATTEECSADEEEVQK